MTDWDAWLAAHHPELKVQERAVVAVFGPAPWTPARESAPKTEPACRNCGNRVKRGSRLYCPACHRSGFDSKLAYQRRLAGVPKPDPRPRAPSRDARPGGASSPPANRRQKRAERFGHGGPLPRELIQST